MLAMSAPASASQANTPLALPAPFARGLAAGKNLFVISSDEALLAQEAADALRLEARARGFSERLWFIVSGAHFKWGEVLASAQAQSLFADKQILELRIPSGKPGKDGGEALQTLADNCAATPDVLHLITLPKLDQQGKKSAWFLALQGAGVVLDIPVIERRQLPAWIAQRLAQQGQSPVAGQDGERSLQWMADRLEGNLLAAHQEIMKLALLYPAGELSFAQISASVASVARYDVFKLSEAVLGGQTQRTQRMLAGLRAEGEAEVLVHWALADDIRALHRVRLALDAGQPLPAAMSAARVWGAKQKHIERLAPRLPVAETTALLHAACQVDGIVKGLPQKDWPSQGWAALERLAMQLCSAAAPMRA
jgi:DNA polymerase-3 subunit delta